jgi:hypothetical protein
MAGEWFIRQDSISKVPSSRRTAVRTAKRRLKRRTASRPASPERHSERQDEEPKRVRMISNTIKDTKEIPSFKSALLRTQQTALEQAVSRLCEDYSAQDSMGPAEESPRQKATARGYIRIRRGSHGAKKGPFVMWPYVGQNDEWIYIEHLRAEYMATE